MRSIRLLAATLLCNTIINALASGLASPVATFSYEIVCSSARGVFAMFSSHSCTACSLLVVWPSFETLPDMKLTIVI